MKKIDGVIFVKTEQYAFCCIENFSNELKEVIRERLACICHGSSKVHTGRIMYSYKATVKEFINRYEKKTLLIKKGLIGELLTHVIIAEMFNEYNVISPFFNLEERSIKKGFDMVLVSKKTQDLIIIEVKSGEKHKGKNSDETMSDLLGLAKNDLISRLNDENTSLWHNAVNGAQSVLLNNDDYKQAIINILEDLGDKSVIGTTDSKDINVFLTGVLFTDLIDCISEKNTEGKLLTIAKQKTFKSVFILSIQKETYVKVYKFLINEVL